MLTRGNSGIGLETVMELASAGCRVILCSRDVEAGKAAVVHSMHRSDSSGNPAAVKDIVVLQLDLADLDSVEVLVNTVRNTEKRLDFLVLNAGVLATPQGYTKQVASAAVTASSSNDADRKLPARVAPGRHCASMSPTRLPAICLQETFCQPSVSSCRDKLTPRGILAGIRDADRGESLWPLPPHHPPPRHAPRPDPPEQVLQ